MTATVTRYRSSDGRFAVELPELVRLRMADLCRRAGRLETGGLLIGRYSGDHSTAHITEICGPPPDSQHHPTLFVRGLRGVQKWIDQLWNQKEPAYYLGEWHFHPFASAQASTVDIEQMRAHAANRKLRCPEPILMILGGDPGGHYGLTCYVFRREGERQELHAIADAIE